MHSGHPTEPGERKRVDGVSWFPESSVVVFCFVAWLCGLTTGAFVLGIVWTLVAG